MAYDRYDTLRIELDSRGVATVMLNRPDKHNSLNAALISDLTVPDPVNSTTSAHNIPFII